MRKQQQQQQQTKKVPSSTSCCVGPCGACMQGLDAASSQGLGMSKSAKHGCLFSTYSTLASGRSNAVGKKTRLEQLVDW